LILVWLVFLYISWIAFVVIKYRCLGRVILQTHVALERLCGYMDLWHDPPSTASSDGSDRHGKIGNRKKNYRPLTSSCHPWNHRCMEFMLGFLSFLFFFCLIATLDFLSFLFFFFCLLATQDVYSYICAHMHGKQITGSTVC
jgi:hypothetical protein